MIVEKLA